MIILIFAAFLSLACFLGLLGKHIHKLTADITKLSHDMSLITSGDLTHKVSLIRDDELAVLAQDINDMRISVAKQIKAEAEAADQQHALVTSLSHDLRTPLTKSIGYLEILMHGSNGAQETAEYIQRAYRAMMQVKERSDQLLNQTVLTIIQMERWKK